MVVAWWVRVLCRVGGFFSFGLDPKEEMASSGGTEKRAYKRVEHSAPFIL